jgi:hypothetical protein
MTGPDKQGFAHFMPNEISINYSTARVWTQIAHGIS